MCILAFQADVFHPDAAQARRTSKNLNLEQSCLFVCARWLSNDREMTLNEWVQLNMGIEAVFWVCAQNI